MDFALWLPSLQVLALIGATYVAWWALGDFVLDRIGIPFVDSGWHGGGDRDARPATSTSGSAAGRGCRASYAAGSRRSPGTSRRGAARVRPSRRRSRVARPSSDAGRPSRPRSADSPRGSSTRPDAWT